MVKREDAGVAKAHYQGASWGGSSAARGRGPLDAGAVASVSGGSIWSIAGIPHSWGGQRRELLVTCSDEGERSQASREQRLHYKHGFLANADGHCQWAPEGCRAFHRLPALPLVSAARSLAQQHELQPQEQADQLRPNYDSARMGKKLDLHGSSLIRHKAQRLWIYCCWAHCP